MGINLEQFEDRDGVLCVCVCFSGAWTGVGGHGGIVTWKNGECLPALAYRSPLSVLLSGGHAAGSSLGHPAGSSHLTSPGKASTPPLPPHSPPFLPCPSSALTPLLTSSESIKTGCAPFEMCLIWLAYRDRAQMLGSGGRCLGHRCIPSSRSSA